MEMKMFIHSSPDMVEKEVNEWLAEKKVQVCHITQSQCERQGRFVLIISIFYSEQHIYMPEKDICFERKSKTLEINDSNS